jgi:hypothetical protein
MSREMKTITLVNGDDWRGIYVDGELRWEGHSLDGRNVLDVLGIDYREVSADLGWLEERGNLPFLESDVEKEK